MAATIPKLSLHESVDRQSLHVAGIVKDWLQRFEKSSKDPNDKDLSNLFIENCWWRDIMALSWEFRGINGIPTVAEYLLVNQEKSGFTQLEPVEHGPISPSVQEMGPMTFIVAGFTFRTKVGNGKGVIRLSSTGPSEWKAWTLFTWLRELDGAEECKKARISESLSTSKSLLNTHEVDGVVQGAEKPVQVVVIGAGSCGLAVAARLKEMDVSTLVIDRSSQVGGAWPGRYSNLKLHSPSYIDNLPYLKYPSNWPIWRTKDQISSWLAHYQQIMGIDVHLSTSASKIDYNPATKLYSLTVTNTQTGFTRTLHPNQIIYAGGIFSPSRIISPSFPNQHLFRGQIYHSTAHTSAQSIPNLCTKRIAIIGTGTSAHDIAQDFAECGAGCVTMIQRNPLYVSTEDSLHKFLYPYHKNPAFTEEEADIMASSLPIPVVRALSFKLGQAMEQNDSELIANLRRAGFAVKSNANSKMSFFDYLVTYGGRFYIDQGASQMIVQGKIKVEQCAEGIEHFLEDGIVLKNGKKIDADVVVLATGLERGDSHLREMLDEDLQSRLTSLRTLDNEGEFSGWWRPTGLPRIWYMPGNLMWARLHSLTLALQVKAVEEGVYGSTSDICLSESSDVGINEEKSEGKEVFLKKEKGLVEMSEMSETPKMPSRTSETESESEKSHESTSTGEDGKISSDGRDSDSDSSVDISISEVEMDMEVQVTKEKEKEKEKEENEKPEFDAAEMEMQQQQQQQTVVMSGESESE